MARCNSVTFIIVSSIYVLLDYCNGILDSQTNRKAWSRERATVEGHGRHCGGDVPTADIDIYVSALAGEVYGDEAHAYVLVQARGTTPAGDLSDRLAIVEDGLTVPGNASGVRGEADKSAIGALFLDLEQGLLADEGARGEVDETAEPGFERVYGRVHVVAVEPEGSFETEAVSGDEAAWFDTRVPELVPQGDGGVGVNNDFNSILSGVAGASDEGIRSWDGDGEDWRVVGVEG